jgi:trimeric autotransporter adhesin
MGNLRLQGCSPAINAGNDAATSTAVDLAGNTRKNGVIDVGAYERPTGTAGTLFVNDNGPADGGDGSNWANALTDLQDALAASSCQGITQIWVAAGTYKPTTGTDRTVSFAMRNSLAIYGGFAGTETQLAQRNWNTNETILSGNIGNLNTADDNSYHVLYNYSNQLNNSAVIDGFTIRDGNTLPNASAKNGAGMYNYDASPMVYNCRFINNLAENGGAVASESSYPAEMQFYRE